MMQGRVPHGDWVAILGKKHGARQRAAEAVARAADQGAAAMSTQCLERWPRIIAAITQIVDEYNVAFDREVLSAAENRSDPVRPAIAIQTGADADAFPSLLASLEGTLICVRSRDAAGISCETESPLRADRNDDETAAYVLKSWIERL
jgi:hypothetical protein